jgi:hypothetical protein
MRLTKFNEETGKYELIKKAKTQEEFMAQRKAVIQRLGEFEDKASDVAEEIFAEIEDYMFTDAIDVRFPVKCINPDKFAELKKKYTEEGK